MGAMTIEQVKAADKRSDPRKLLSSTIAFLKELREEVNKGKERRGEALVPWTEEDEARYPIETLQASAPRYAVDKAKQVWTTLK
jgi:CHASE1-domain containing sensor protein